LANELVMRKARGSVAPFAGDALAQDGALWRQARHLGVRGRNGPLRERGFTAGTFVKIPRYDSRERGSDEA